MTACELPDRVCRVLGEVPIPAAWRERGKGTVAGVTGHSLPSAAWGFTESELFGEDSSLGQRG